MRSGRPAARVPGTGALPDMDDKTFKELCGIVYAQSGIHLGPGKKALLSARLVKRLRALGITGYRDYLRLVRDADPEGAETEIMIDCISTNVTAFYREPEHFAFVTDAVRGWAREGQREFRFWSTACATGEEPFSLAISLLEGFRDEGFRLRILATDISTRALAVCREGVYPAAKVDPLGRYLRARYFSRDAGGDLRYRVRDLARRLVAFHRLNLSVTPYPMRGPFDVVLCRNVMLYFDAPTRERLLAEAGRLLRPGGYLLVGHAESLAGMQAGFRPIRPSIYQRDDRAAPGGEA